jgi:arylsulfatase A-like enzyme
MKVVVINAWALHLGYLGCYGNEWVETPNLDRLAAEGVVFDQHYAANPGTPTARACWTGRYNLPFPAGNVNDGEAWDAPSNCLKEALAQVPFRVVDPHHLQPVSGDEGNLLEQTFQAALGGLDQLASHDHWLLWIDLPSLAPPWQVPEEFVERYFPEAVEEDEKPLQPWPDPPLGPLDATDDTALERLQNTYAAVVAHFDDCLGLLLEDLHERGLKDQVLLCVTAERGLALGEHGIVGDYFPWLHDEVIHLPLFVRLPGGAEAGRRVAALTQPMDLLPTLLDAFGLPVPVAVQGHSLGPLLRGEKEQVRAYTCSGWELDGRIEWVLRTPAWGFVLPGGPELAEPRRVPQLYVKPDDRWEVNNVIQHHLELAEHLEETLKGFIQAAARPGPLEPPELRDVEAELARAEPQDETNPSNPGDQP